MSIILGLNIFHADSSASIIYDDRLQYAIEEERINRFKHWAGFPYNSIEHCLKNGNINLEDVTDICVNSNPFSNLTKKTIYFIKNYLIGKKKFEIFKRIKNKINIKNFLVQNFHLKNLNKNIKIHYIDHHASHISSAFFSSGYENAMGLSIDGFGDFCSVCIAECSQEKIKIVDKIYFPNSLGVFYESFTQFIGFHNYGEEYKMMGLSGYGDSIYENKIKKVFFDFEKLKLDLSFFNHTKRNFEYKFDGVPIQNRLYSNKIEKLLNIEENKITEKQKKDIASSVQKIFELKLIDICLKISKNKFSKNLVYAGGCALNSLANKKVYDSKLFDKIYIPYAPGDAGGSIGSSLYAAKFNLNKNISNLKSPYLGKNYNNHEVEIIIEKRKLKNLFQITFFKNKNDLLKNTAYKLWDNKIIGFFNGKMEFGPRALGNRSILANPCNPNMKEILNLKIKKRENFRPFAPSILQDLKNEWFNNNNQNPYMSSVESINFDKRKLIPAVTHIDGTGRVQTVSKELNLDFYNLILNFYKVSKVPILLNTSFNESEPIVMSPEHAIDCFERTNIDCLVIENFLIER